jgi:hypothetical protein
MWHAGAKVETTAKGLVRIVHPDGSEQHHQPCATRYSPSRLEGLAHSRCVRVCVACVCV